MMMMMMITMIMMIPMTNEPMCVFVFFFAGKHTTRDSEQKHTEELLEHFEGLSRCLHVPLHRGHRRSGLFFAGFHILVWSIGGILTGICFCCRFPRGCCCCCCCCDSYSCYSCDCCGCPFFLVVFWSRVVAEAQGSFRLWNLLERRTPAWISNERLATNQGHHTEPVNWVSTSIMVLKCWNGLCGYA